MVLHIFTIVKIKKGPTVTDSASYSMSSCPFSLYVAKNQLNAFELDS